MQIVQTLKTDEDHDFAVLTDYPNVTVVVNGVVIKLEKREASKLGEWLTDASREVSRMESEYISEKLRASVAPKPAMTPSKKESE